MFKRRATRIIGAAIDAITSSINKSWGVNLRTGMK